VIKKLSKNRVVNITHRDLDGIISAALVKKCFPNVKIVFSGPRRIVKTLKKIRGEFGHLIITDIGVNEPLIDNIVTTLRRLKQKGWKITWIDHHTWSQDAIKKIGETINEILIGKANAACELVADYLSLNDEVSKKLVEIGVDADTANYELEESKYLDPIVKKEKLALKLIDQLSKGIIYQSNLYLEGKRRYEKFRLTIDKLLTKRVRIERTMKGRKFAIIDLRHKKTLKSQFNMYVVRKLKVDFIAVIHSCNSLGLYAGIDKSVNLLPIALKNGGGGHPFACGFEVRVPIFKRILCTIFPKYLPRELREQIEEIKRLY